MGLTGLLTDGQAWRISTRGWKIHGIRCAEGSWLSEISLLFGVSTKDASSCYAGDFPKYLIDPAILRLRI